MAENSRTLISFDWALKKLLRNRANFEILEGFLSVLLEEDITVKNILESESNADFAVQKINRVDLIAEISTGELILIEIQYNTEYDFFQRMLFATSKLITDYMNRGMKYEEIRKIYSVNLIYFDLGQGEDYVYRGQTVFRGIHQDDVLQLSPTQQKNFGRSAVSALYPEYFVIKINNFNDVAKDSLDEWIYYFKNNRVEDEFRAKGLDKVREKLQLDALNKDDKKVYDAFIEDMLRQESVMKDARVKGLEEGFREGQAKGFESGMERGIEKGMEQGIEKGRSEEKYGNIVKAIKRGKLTEDEIADDFGVAANYVHEIKNTL